MMIMLRRYRTSAGPDCDRFPDFQGVRLQTADTDKNSREDRNLRYNTVAIPHE